MGIHYSSVVPWGRSFDEYTSMFALSELDLDARILGCGDGPASFNAEMKRRGRRTTSVDPIYALSKDEIAKRIEETRVDVLQQTERNRDKFVWDHIPSVEELDRVRMDAMRLFLEDYEAGRKEDRYVPGEAPELLFGTKAFDLALSSHFLFLYAQQLSEDMHIETARELCRVAREVRIFPLVDVNAERPPHVDLVIDALRSAGHQVQEVRVPYEFQRGANKMLQIVTA